MENTMVIKSNLSVVDYVSLVNAIASEFFDTDGEYQPHIGRMNALRLFYNECVTESKFDLPHDFDDALMMDVLVEDEEFIKAFNDTIKGDGMIRLDFANAYAEAIEIVDARKGSLGNAVEILKNGISKLIEKITPMFSEDNIEKFSKIADDISNGNFSPDAIVEAYGKSKRFEEVIK